MTREELFDKLKAGARWDVGVSINRSNSLPLDANSIFESYEIASTYASKNKEAITALGLLDNAYIGQILTVVENDAVKIYVIDNNQQLQPIGNADDLTITTDDNGNLTLYGFEEATVGKYPRVATREVGEGEAKVVEKYIEWVDVEIPAVTEGTYISVTTSDGDYVVAHKNAPELAINNAETEGSRFVSEITRDAQGHITGYKTEKVNIPDVSLDEVTIDRTSDGKIEIKGAGTAQPTKDKGLLPQLIQNEDGTKALQWVTINTAIEGATEDTVTIGDGTSIQDKANDNSADHVLEIKGVRVAENAGKILSTDGAGNVSWVNDQDTIVSVKDGDGENKGIKVTKTTTPEAGADVTYEIAHEKAPITGTNAANKGTGTGRTYVTDVLVDDMGHIAGVKTATETVVNTDTDTKTAVTSGDDYIIVTPATGLEGLDIGGNNTFEISIDEDKLIELIGHSTTAAMEFKGATAVLPSDENTNDGDMYKVIGEIGITVTAEKDAQGAGFTANTGDAIVAKVVSEDTNKVVTWYYIPSANDQDTWRPVEVNGKAIGDKTLNLKPGYCISLTNNNGAVTIGLNTSDLTIEESNLSNDLKASVAAANNAVEKDRLVEYITATAPVDIISTTEFPTTDDYPGQEGTTLGGNYYITEEEFLLEPNATYILTINSASSSNEKYYATATDKDGYSGDVSVTFNVADDALVFRSGHNNGTPYTEVWYGAMGPTPMIGDKEKYIGASMTLQREPIYDLGIEKGAQVNYINDVDEDQFTVTGKKLALNADLADKIDSALQPVEGASVGHYAVFNAEGKIADGGCLIGQTRDGSNLPINPGDPSIPDGFTFGVYEHLSGDPLGPDNPADQNDNPLLQVGFVGDSNYITVQRIAVTDNDDNSLIDDAHIATAQVSLTDAAKASLAKADSAIQEITSNCTNEEEDHPELNCTTSGLKVTQNKDDEQKVIPGSYNIELDDSITFILNCGSAADL